MKKQTINIIDFGDWPLPEEVLAEIGRLHSLWSCMESALSMAIGKLAGYDDIYDIRPQILLTHTTFQQKLSIFSSLCDFLSKDYPNLSKYRKVIALLKTAQTQRNKYTHQSVVYDSEIDELKLVTSSAREKLKTSVTKIDISDIKRVIISIDEANVAMYELVLNKKLKPVYQRIINGGEKV